MTTDPRINRLEGVVEELGKEVRELRSDFRSLRSELNSRLNTQLTVSVVLWLTTIGSIIGLFFKS